MNKRQIVRNIVSFEWVVQPYPMVWANSPSEVPIWDASRGFSIDEASTIQGAANDLEALRALMRDDKWQPLAPPADGYPRLVREHYRHLSPDRFRTKDNLLNPVASLARHYPFGKFPGKRLLNEVHALAETFGPPAEPEHHTLWAWLRLSLEADAQIETKNALSALGLEGVENFVAYRDAPWAAAYKAAEVERRQHKAWSAVAPVPGGEWCGPWDELNFIAQQSNSAKDFVGRMAQHNRELFGLAKKDVEFHPPGLYVYGGARALLYYRLAEMWQEDAPIRECEVCHRFFIPTNKKHKVCRGACRTKLSEEKNRQAATS